MRTATLLLRALLLIPLVALIGLPAAANAAGPLATARASSTGHFITTAPLGPSFSLGALAWPSTSSAALKSVISRDGTVAFISQSANGGQVASYARDPDTGALGAQLSVQLTQANQGGQMALTPDGTQLFVATFDGADAWLDHFTVQPNGSLTPTGSTRTWTLDQISDIVVSPDGASVYMALSSTPSNIHQFDLAGSTLSAKTPMQVSTGGNLTSGLLFTNDATRLHAFYPDSDGSHAITYEVDAATGRLTPVGSLPAATNRGSLQGSALMGDGRTVVQISQSALYTWQVGTGGVVGARSSGQAVPSGLSLTGLAAATGGSRVYLSSVDLLGMSPEDGVIYSAEISGGLPQSLAAASPFPTTAMYWGITLGPAQPPVAALAGATGQTGAAVAFDASASASPDPQGGGITRYDWDFGDGTTLADGGPTPSHTYSAAGTYTATVTVTNAAGCSTGDGVWAGRMYSCAGGPSARTTATATITDPAPPPAPSAGGTAPAPAAPAPAPASSPTALPVAVATPADRARSAYRAERQTAVARRTAALRACTRRSRASRAACRSRATRAYRRSVGLAAATRTRAIALERCEARDGSARARCTALARARFTRDAGLARCQVRTGDARTRCVRVARARHVRDAAIVRCQVRTGAARAACVRTARARYARAVRR